MIVIYQVTDRKSYMASNPAMVCRESFSGLVFSTPTAVADDSLLADL